MIKVNVVICNDVDICLKYKDFILKKKDKISKYQSCYVTKLK